MISVPMPFRQTVLIECEGLCERWTPHTFHKSIQIEESDNTKTYDQIFRCTKCLIDRQYGRVVAEDHAA